MSVALDLTVNSNSERGLLGIALDKYFRHNGFVYLYWSETTLAADNTDALTPCRCWATGSTASTGTAAR